MKIAQSIFEVFVPRRGQRYEEGEKGEVAKHDSEEEVAANGLRLKYGGRLVLSSERWILSLYLGFFLITTSSDIYNRKT